LLKKILRVTLITLGALIGLILLAALTFRFGGPKLQRAVYFAVIGTTDPYTVLNQQTPPATHIAYGPDPLEFGELSLPQLTGPATGTNFPVAIILHGGCWRATLGGLPPEMTSHDLLRPLAAALNQQGIATWNVEYRRAGNPGGGWPGTYQDLGLAADDLRNLAAANHLDLSRVIVIGHSAGGQLALWLAARKKLPPSSEIYRPNPLPIKGVVDIDGPPSLTTAAPIDDLVCGTHVVQEFLGGTPQQVPTRYQQGSADGLLPTGVPQQLLYSAKTEFLSKDRSQWSNLFTNYAAEAKKSGDQVDVTRMEKAGHFDGINPKSKTWPTVLAKIKAALGG
jgi:acetyl esterase/lipase